MGDAISTNTARSVMITSVQRTDNFKRVLRDGQRPVDRVGRENYLKKATHSISLLGGHRVGGVWLTTLLPTLTGVSKLETGAEQARRKLEILLNKLGY